MTGVPAPAGPAWALSPSSKALCPGSHLEVFHAQPGMACPHVCPDCGQRVSSSYYPAAVGGGRLDPHYPTVPRPAVPVLEGQLGLFQEAPSV